MTRIKVLGYLGIYTLGFYLLLLLGESFFSVDTKNQYIQENYIEKTSQEDDYTDLNTPLTEKEKIAYKKRVLQKRIQDTKNLVELPADDSLTTKKYSLVYIPDTIAPELIDKTTLLDTFLQSEIFSPKISYLRVEMIEKVSEVRGKFKDSAIKLFGIFEIPKDELFAVSIHEFGHYIDLYFLDQNFKKDPSDDFYSISWESTKTLKKGSKQADFVSGYAMTNKYEDFAESFTYYVLHNAAFAQKAKQSDVLAAKYDFFSRKVFQKSEFQSHDFSTEPRIKSYYRDTTKIGYDIEKFLQYLKKAI